MKGRPFYVRMGFAVAGLKESWRRESSFRIQVGIAGLALVVLLVMRPAPIWWAALALAAGLVLAFELMNSALEAVIDHLHPAVHREIKAAKDMASAAVLTSGFAAVAVAAALIIDRFIR